MLYEEKKVQNVLLESFKDCSQAESDCSQAESDCSQAESDCIQAESDCSQAESDCSQAESDCSQAESDCSQAETASINYTHSIFCLVRTKLELIASAARRILFPVGPKSVLVCQPISRSKQVIGVLVVAHFL